MSEQPLQDAASQIESLEGESGWTWQSWQVILLLMNAFLGLCLFEWAWYQARRFRRPIKELEELMPAYRRNDSARWARWKFYPGAMTIAIPRFLIGVVIALCQVLLLKIVLIGQPMNDPITGWRRTFIRWAYKLAAFLFQLLTNFVITTSNELTLNDVDHYQEWLGPISEQEKEQIGGPRGFQINSINYDSTSNTQHLLQHSTMNSTDVSDNAFGQSPRNDRASIIPKRGRGPASTVVCNHIGWIDIMALIQSKVHPGFTPKDELRDVPLLGVCCRGLQSLFVFRGNDDAAKQRIVEQIIERQSAIEDDCQEFNPICIFAEGTTSNGSALAKFKRGAFEGMRTVIPTFVKVGDDRYMLPAYDTLPFWSVLIMYYSSFCFHHVRITIMPEFTPTNWMLENQSHKGKEPWQIYSECVREAMIRHGEFVPENRRIRDKLAYEAMMCCEKDSAVIDGRSFTYASPSSNSHSKNDDDAYVAARNGPSENVAREDDV